MTNARGHLQSMLTSIQNLLEEPDLFIDEFVTELHDLDFRLYDIVCVPHCYVCGAVDVTVEWCGGCGCCTDHCELSDSCEEWATEQLELMQGGN